VITASMDGRRLKLTIDAAPDEPALEPFVVAPLSARDGRAMSIRYLLNTEGVEHDGPTMSEDLVAAFGAENYERGDTTLHADLLGLLAQAAYYWQTLGGMAAVRALLDSDPLDGGEQGGPVARGKALTVLRSRLVPLLSETRRLSESGRRTPEGSTPVTDSRPSGEPSASVLSEPPPEPSSPSPSNPERSASPSD